MKTNTMTVAGREIPIISCHVLVVGAGAAGLAAACHLKRLGVDDVLLIANAFLRGTSRNTGSDKQTYYKLSLQGDTGDSVGGMAADLFAGGAVDGDMPFRRGASSTWPRLGFPSRTMNTVSMWGIRPTTIRATGRPRQAR
jgi:hypothetical protein